MKEQLYDIIDRKFNVSDGCWNFKNRNTDGYAVITVSNKKYRVHRLMYERFIEPIYKDNVIDHLCGNRLCVNPFHLEQVTLAENTRRGVYDKNFRNGVRENHCSSGHLFTEENTYLHKSKTSVTGYQRKCKECLREYRIDYKKRKVLM